MAAAITIQHHELRSSEFIRAWIGSCLEKGSESSVRALLLSEQGLFPPRRHKALQFFKPIEHYVDLCGRGFSCGTSLDHEEAPAIT